MISVSLDAVLKTDTDQFLEKGTLVVPPTGTTVDFKNDFVPLVRIGHTVKIGIVIAGQTCINFSGEVYLSSKNLLRLVSVDSKILDQIRSFFASNTNFPISFEVTGSVFSRLLGKQNDIIDGNVYYLTSDSLNFHSINQVEVGQQLLVNLDHPVSLRNVIIRINDKDRFGVIATRYSCSIVKISSACQRNIDEYVASLPSNDDIPTDDEEF